MRFVDLFAGLGGFHLALRQLRGECVFACEVDDRLRALYDRNFGAAPAGDIRDVDGGTIPRHDGLCAGFACQAFPEAEERTGHTRGRRGGPAPP